MYPITGYAANGAPTRAPTTAARCPLGYTQYDSESPEDTWWNDTVTPEAASSVRAAKCFASCPTAGAGELQGVLDDTGLCAPDACPINETKTGYAGSNGAYTYFPEAASGELPTSSTSGTLDARTKVCKRDPGGTYSASNPGGEKISRSFELPFCPSTHEIALYDSYDGTTTYATATGIRDIKNTDGTSRYNFSTLDASTTFTLNGVNVSDTEYPRYFQCTAKCTGGSQRIGKYCYFKPGTATLLEHVDDTNLNTGLTTDPNGFKLTPGDQLAFDPLITPADDNALRRVMKTYRVAPGDAANNQRDKFDFTYTSSGTAFPAVSILEYRTVNDTPNWYFFEYADAFAAPATSTTCPSGYVKVPRWREPQASDAAVIAAKTFLASTLDGSATTETEIARRWAKRLFMYDTGAAPAHALWSGTFACMKAGTGGEGALACKKKVNPDGTAPVGFVETATSTQSTDSSGNTTTTVNHSLTVYCSPYGSSDDNACASNSSTGTSIGMTNDPVFANVCVRSAGFLDPLTTPANQCGGNRVLMGKATRIPDLASATGGGEYDGYYDAEEAPSTFKRAQCDELYSATKVYKYDDVVAFGQDMRAELDTGGNEWAGEPGAGIINPRYMAYLGPFFRCIKATGAAFGAAASVFPAGYDRNAASLGATRAARAQASYDASQYAAAAWYEQQPLTSTHWTTVDVPNQYTLDGLRRAGVGGLHKTKCTRDGSTLKYCPPLCVDPCPAPRPDPSDPTSQYGLYEPVYETTGSEVTGAVCYPRCGSTKQFTASGRFCITKRAEMAKPMVSGFSWCSPDGIAPIRDRELGELPSGPSTDPTGTTKEACQANGNHWTNGTCYVVNNKCYDVCPEGFTILNKSPYKTCITECPQNERFVDAEDRCIKVPYQRALLDGEASDAPLTLAEQQAQVETNLAGTATTVSKIALSGGTASFIRAAIIGILAAGALLLLLILIKRARISADRGAF